MINKILKLILLILTIIGIYFGVSITLKKNRPDVEQKKIEENLISRIQTKTAQITNFYTYGRSFNIKGKFVNVNKDNFENVKLIITDGKKYEKEVILDYSFDENNLSFSSEKEINNGIIIDYLEEGTYYLLLRLKLNNNIDPKYYSLKNEGNSNNIIYYTITSNNQNKKAEINFENIEQKGKTYSFLKINLKNCELPEEVYDVVIDAGHGGTDSGEKFGSFNEADINLDYAKLLKSELEDKGYKVKLTRDDLNTNSYTKTNMYDSDGRISIACKSKAKLMISLHINNGKSNLTGFEVYSPTKSNLVFASTLANKIKEYTSLNYSNNTSFKMIDGVYVRNYTESEIKALKTSEKKYEPYNITTTTPYNYTIREVGGIATEAYVDGRNKSYSKNEYYNSNQGIECYQLELGYIKNDLDKIINEKDAYINAIAEAISEKY